MERVKRFTGVHFYESENRRHQGKPDRCFYITFKDLRGKKVWEKVGWASEGYTAAMASEIRAERLRTLRHGHELPKKKQEITFAEAWDKYLEWAKGNKKTYVYDENRYPLHIKPHLAEKTLREITPFDIEKIKTDMTEKGLAPQTVKHVLALIRRIYNKCIEWDLYSGENPIKKVKIPSTERFKRIRFLSYEEAHRLLAALEKHSRQVYEICLLSLHTGMRASEVFALRWGDIDLEHGIIHVHGKGDVPREAYIDDTLKEMLQQRQRGEPNDLLFVARDGGTIDAISDTFERVVDKVGLNNGVKSRAQKVVFHTLRHTFASWLAIQGTPLLTIMELMGHKDIKMTMRYAHLIPDQKRTAVHSLDSCFRGSRPETDQE